MKKIIKIIIAPLFGILFSFLLLEIGTRLVLKLQKPKPEWSDRPKYYFQSGNGAPTLQDYKYDLEKKPENTFRIGIIGDSFTFAPYMQFTDAFPKVLERMLNLESTSKKLEVINYGVPGYSTSHEVEPVLETLKSGTDLVILEITLNDPELKPYRPTGIKVFNNWGLPELSGWKKILAKYSKFFGLVFQRIGNRESREDYKNYHLDLFQNPRSWSVFEKSLKQINDAVSKENKKMVAVVFPLFGFPLDDNYPFKPSHEKVDNLLKTLSIPSLDLFNLYKGIPLDRIVVMPGKDRHPNEIAHRMAAEEIYEFLAGLKLIPDEFLIKNWFRGRTQVVKEERR